jgi:hypothetical protein
MFWGRFTVLNESNENLYITPIGERSGQRRVLLEQSSRFPYAPILKQADVRLDPGESVQIHCRGFDEPSWTLAVIAVRNERREYRQLTIDESTSNFMSWISPEPTYQIESFDELSRAFPEVVEIAKRASRPNFTAWMMIAAGFIPIGLFSAWLALVWKLRQERRSERESSAA